MKIEYFHFPKHSFYNSIISINLKIFIFHIKCYIISLLTSLLKTFNRLNNKNTRSKVQSKDIEESMINGTSCILKNMRKNRRRHVHLCIHPNTENSTSVFVSKMTKNANGEAKKEGGGVVWFLQWRVPPDGSFEFHNRSASYHHDKTAARTFESA